MLSPKRFNEVTGYASVCPISRTERKWGFHIPIPDDQPVEGVIIADQIKNLNWKTRNARIVGQAPNNFVNRVVKVIHTYSYEEDQK